MRSDFAMCPDRRFIDAIAMIHNLITNEVREVVDTQFNGRKWIITYKKQSVGELNEIPEFSEMYKLLVAWASKVAEQKHSDSKIGANTQDLSRTYSATEAQLIEMSPESLFAALRNIDGQLKNTKQDPRLIKLAVRARALMLLQSFDLLEINDYLSVSALAYLALYEGQFKKEAIEEAALIADALAYHKAARTLASRLPPTEPVSLYFGGEKKELDKAAGASSANRLADYLYLRVICKDRDKDLWRKWLMKHSGTSGFSSLSILRASAEMHIDEMMLPIAIQILGLAKSEVANEKSREEIKPADLEWQDVSSRLPAVSALLGPNLLTDFEKSLSRGNDNSAQIDLGENERRNFYRAYFFSAIDIIAKTTVALPSARLFSRRLQECLRYDGPAPSRDLASWTTALSRLNSGDAGESDLQNWMLGLEGLGPASVVSLFGVCRSFPLTHELMFSSGELLFVRVDTRPTVRLPLASIAQQPLLDLDKHRKLVLSAIRDGVAESVESNLLLTRMMGNKLQIMALLLGDKATLQERLGLLQILNVIAGQDRNLIVSQYKVLLKKYPTSWDIMREYVGYLNKTNKPAAVAEMKNWLKSHKQSSTAERSPELFHARLILSQLLYETKDFTSLRSELKVLPENTSMPYLKLRALSDLESGKFGSAKAWSELCRRSYPDSLDAILLQLEVAWKQNEFLPAANILARAPQVSRVLWKEKIGALLMKMFPTDRQLIGAVSALTKVGFDSDDNLGQIAAAAFSADRSELAFNILSSTKYHPADAADIKTCLYRYLKRAKGKENALAWLKEQIPESERAQVAPYAFISGQDELLFEFAPLEVALESGEQIWILRAAATVLNPALKNTWQSQLNAHFSGREDWPGLVGRYLLSEPVDAEIETMKVTSKERAMAAFYLAWKKMAQSGHFLDDTEWLRQSLYERQPGLDESRWALVWLRDISSTLAGQPLIYSDALLQRLRVVAPQSDGAWSEQRRFKLTTK